MKKFGLIVGAITLVIAVRSCGGKAKHVIDCDAAPLIPERGFTVEEHKKGGQLTWNASKVKLYLAEDQTGHPDARGRYIVGHRLRKELENKPALNANVLNYLLAHQELIPEDWKGLFVTFWGTIYRYRPYNDEPHVCYLYWWDEDKHWRSGCMGLGIGWRSNFPAALSAK